MIRHTLAIFSLSTILAGFLGAGSASKSKFFQITVVDEQTGRGVPLVELKTVHNVRYYTDSNGIVAFHEPGLMGQKVFFHIKSHGYEYPKDGFGFRGKALEVSEGGQAILKIKRLNIAERLYRVTGGGIYRDSVLLGKPTPTRQPVLNGKVFGSDSVVTAVYQGKVYWFWGDTNRPAYPLGNFYVPGATSLLPGKGGLDPDVGVNLEYFLDDTGFAKATAKLPGPGPCWINGLVVLTDKAGRERMFAAYARIRGVFEVYQRGLVEFDDAKKQFVPLAQFDAEAPLHPAGHSFHHEVAGSKYIYFANPYPVVRVRADVDFLKDPARYEAFTCLAEGSSLKDPRIDRGEDGKPRWGWQKNTPALTPEAQERLVKAGVLKAEEATLHLRDDSTGKTIKAHAGSVAWNEHRRRWVMIAVESFGTSFLGEVWYAEAEAPLGPWVGARKIVTHEKYSFYNPRHHPFLDKEGGRFIYFEGTYTREFSGNPEPTPYYDYNQIMYKLDLDDPRWKLP